jgi:disulfide bond formation protein DsbB
MYNLKVEAFIKIIFLVSLVSIISAYFIEYALGHQPCNLCLIERIPYGLAIVLIIFNHILIKDKKFIILLLILVFSFSLIISFYHFGIEQGIFEESALCGLKDSSNIVSKEELLKQLQIKNVSCQDVTFRIFGFSLTSLNIIISLILVIFLSKTFKNYEKFKK